jgi:hypothetical protein
MNVPELETPFSKNWNGKLWCDYLTTIRLLNPAKYKVGSIHWLTLMLPLATPPPAPHSRSGATA